MADKANWRPKPEYCERQYRRVDTRLWNDRRFRSFTATGRMVWLFLLTNPRTTSIPGLFPLHEEEAARMCGLSLEGFREGFAQPFREGLVEADWEAGLVWLRNASRYDSPTGPNVVAAWRKVARMSLPECPLLWRALTGIREQLREVMSAPEPFLEAFAKAFPEPLGGGFPEGFAPTDDGRRMTDDGVFLPSEGAASRADAVAPPPTDDLPDATDDVVAVTDAREPFVLVPPTPAKRERTPSAAEALYALLEEKRQLACADEGVEFIPSRWAFSRQNKDLKALAIAKAADNAEWKRFQGAWLAFMTDEKATALRRPYALEWFFRCRGDYEAQGLRREEPKP